MAAISAMTPQVPEAYRLADAFRARNIPVVMGGAHASLGSRGGPGPRRRGGGGGGRGTVGDGPGGCAGEEVPGGLCLPSQAKPRRHAPSPPRSVEPGRLPPHPVDTDHPGGAPSTASSARCPRTSAGVPGPPPGRGRRRDSQSPRVSLFRRRQPDDQAADVPAALRGHGRDGSAVDRHGAPEHRVGQKIRRPPGPLRVLVHVRGRGAPGYRWGSKRTSPPWGSRWRNTSTTSRCSRTRASR